MRALFIALCLCTGAIACSGPEEPGPTSAVVTNVVDGDTIDLDSGDRIRYLLIDTPESVGGADDCYGTESSDFNRGLVEGKEVKLTYDPIEPMDRFGRLLAFVEVDGREVNRLLVERGFACVLYIPPAGEERHNEFETLEAMAEADGRGLWGACEEVTCD